MSRVRLTARGKQAADGSIPYPGNVNQERRDPAWEQYHTFEQRVNHELPDMRHDWQDDERDDIGFGVPEPWGKSPAAPTVASVRVAANKAVRMAVLMLGEKVDDETIEKQARDFMSMSPVAMDRTLSRFADTQKLYAEDKDEEKKAEDKDDEKCAAEKKDEPPAFIKEKIEEKKDDKKASRDLAEKMAEEKAEDKAEKKAEDKVEEKVEEKKAAEEKVEEKKAADDEEKKVEARLAKLETMIASLVKASSKKADAAAPFTPAIAKPGAETEGKAQVEVKAEDKKDEEKKAEDKADEKKAEDKDEKKAGANEMDIELSGATDEGDEEMDPETASQLASLFTGADDEEVDQKKVESSKKAGIKKLGGQPRVASASVAGTDISNIWETAPDVSEVFR